MHTLLVFVSLAVILSDISVSGYERICYFTNWSQYRPDPMRFLPENIDPLLCTKIIFAYADLENNRLIPTQPNDEEMYARVLALKAQNPTLTVSLATGGSPMGTEEMSAMLATQENRTEFITTTISYLRTNSLDGVDLGFAFPGSRGSPPEDKQRFTMLLQELRAAIDQEAVDTGRQPLLSSVAVGCFEEVVENGYEIDIIPGSVDWVGLMSYDFTAPGNNESAHNSPLEANDADIPDFYTTRNIQWCVNHWIDNGTPRDKLIVGLATYGRGVTLSDQDDTSLYAPASGVSAPGPWTGAAGSLAYYENCEMISSGASVVYDNEYNIPYLFLGDQWHSYDDSTSFGVKANFVIDNNLAGVMAWSLDQDDFTGTRCGEGVSPLYNVLRALLPQ